MRAIRFQRRVYVDGARFFSILRRVMFFALRQNVRLGPLATLHPRTFLQRLGLLTLFPLHRLLRFLVDGIVVYTLHIIPLLKCDHLGLQSSNTFLHAFYLGRFWWRARPDVTQRRAACPVQHPNPQLGCIHDSSDKYSLRQLGGGGE